MDLTPKQQTSEAIRQSETILVTTGQHPSVDQVAAVIALTAILRKFGKKVSAVVSDNLPQAVNLLDVASIERNLGGMRDFVLKVDTSRAEVGGLRYEPVDAKLNIFLTPAKGNFAPSDVTFDYGEASFEYDLAIVLGVPTRARIDRVYEQNLSLFEQIPVINLDFHRSNENYGAVNLIEPNASSLCEMLVALSESLQSGIIDEQIATALLMGIVGSTDRFTASHTTSKSLTVAAQMMAAGAKQQAVVRALYREGREQGRGAEARGGERGGERGGNDGRGQQRDHREQGAQREQGQRNDQNHQGQRNDQGGQRAEQGHQGRDSQSQREREPRPDREHREQGAQSEHAQVQTPAQPAQPAQSQPQSAPAAPDAAAIQAVATQPVAQPQQSAQPAQAQVAQPQVVQDARPFRGGQEADLPIIEPGHIELSAPEPDHSAAAPQEPIMQPYPVADFAAATEALQRPPQDQSGPST